MYATHGGKMRGPRDHMLSAILILSLILHSYHLAYPAWDYHNWRQSITLMVARNFAEHGFDLTRPQVAWVSHGDPSAPSYFSAEFPIMSILAALLYKVFGEHDLVARMVVIGLSLLGIWSLYGLMRRHAGVVPARIAAFVYALLPYHLFFGRVFMPEIPAQALALAALDALDRWTINRKWITLSAASALLSLAVLQKLTVAFVLLPAFYLFWQVYGKRVFTHVETYSYLAITGIPAVLWYRHAVAMSHESGFAIMQPGLFGRGLELWLQAGFVRQIVTALTMEAFSPVGLVLAVAGLVCPSRSRAAWIFRFWVVGATLMLFFVPEVLPANRYYLTVLLPGAAALTGLALGSLSTRATPILLGILLIFAVGAVRCAIPLYGDDRAPYDLGVLLRHLSAKRELLITETGGSPNVLYYADRRGWMVSGLYSPEMADRLARLGARYYANAFGMVPEGQAFFRRMEQLSERLTSDDSPWTLYDLQPAARFSETEVQTSPPVNFADRIEFHGLTLRRLLHKPSVFEVIFRWQGLTTAKQDVNGFIHVVDSTGRTVYQQGHWPPGRRLSIEGKPGETFQGRYVLALPESLAAGKYQLRIGWYDPARQARLPIMTAGASDGEDRATVAKVEAYGPRVFHWFNVR